MPGPPKEQQMGQRSSCSMSKRISHGINGTRGDPALHPVQQHHLSYTCAKRYIPVHIGIFMCTHECARPQRLQMPTGLGYVGTRGSNRGRGCPRYLTALL